MPEPTIFLSYANQDALHIHDVYTTLKRAGLNPWMDAPPAPYQLEGLTPGVPWDDMLREQLHKARVTLAFMSKNSVAKEGYVQREFRLALSACATKPAGTASLIPVLLDPCTPPNYRVDTISLHDLQWYKLYEQGLDNLVLHLQAMIGPPKGTSVPSADYLTLVMQVNDLRIDREYQLRQIEKLSRDKARAEAENIRLMAEDDARLSRYREDDKFRHSR